VFSIVDRLTPTTIGANVREAPAWAAPLHSVTLRRMRPIEDGALSGSFVLRHREILREKLGANVFAAGLATMAPDLRAAIDSVPRAAWVPVDAVEALFAAAAKGADRDVRELHGEVVAIATDITIRSIWRVLLRLTSDAQLIAQTPVVYRKAWNRGTLIVQSASKGGAELALTSWPDMPEFAAHGVQVAVERALTLAGRKSVSITAAPTADGFRYSARWG
jgi:hypothetical protein